MQTRIHLTQNEMWQALTERDARADDSFVYGVITTGIFCRPTCPSRRPKPENVRFFADCTEAEATGLRACQRCNPAGTSPLVIQLEAVKSACRLLRDELENPSLSELAAQANLSPGHFQRTFKRIVGITPKQYAIFCRKRRLRELLQADGRITDAIYNAGYNSSGVAYSGLSETLGMSPSRYRSGAVGLTLRYTCNQTRLGWMLVAVSAKGVCAIEFGSNKNALRDAIAARFTQAQLLEDKDGLQVLIEEIVRFIDQPAIGLDLPLDIQGTVFQHQVWDALRNIPAGAQHSYSEVAQAIGKPRAVRAVASACAKNPVALAIPCHRVVRSGGGLGGYRWGVERKQALLEREAE